MDFFEKLGDTITTKGKEVTGKAKDLAEIANLKGQIGTCEDVIKKNYIEIGRLSGVLHSAGGMAWGLNGGAGVDSSDTGLHIYVGALGK